MTDPAFALESDIPRNARIARWLLFRLLSGIREGSLTVREGQQTLHFGDESSALRAEVQILAPGVYCVCSPAAASPRPNPGWRVSGRRIS
ncbi:Uncharacterised protein [Serratia fonticola]|uniref:Uncharacterized protein n=1 Tax=Serratia fonticola TaxID=47917 RepID=A0A4U9W9P8_SERFO|nr:Uncharacterised protein [Serratia fonticola]